MGPDRILIADVDGTLVGDDAALERFVAWHTEDRPSHRLVYATGRHRDSLEQLIAGTALPVPDATITAVGTEIHDEAGRRWPGWPERFVGFEADVIRLTLRRFRWLALQPDDAQTPRKVSYDIRDLAAGQISEIHAALVTSCRDARLVYSAGLHLDILPAQAGKGNAARFLASAWGASPGKVMVFGDTGNDIELFRHGFRGTVVANALPELREAVDEHAYRSPLSYADGVLDGIRHWSGPGTTITGPRRTRRR